MIDGVHIWRAALDEAGWPGAERLPAGERARAASFLREEAGRRWAAARWALRRALAEYLGGPAEAIELDEGDGGKPRLRANGEVRFNLSHSGGLALVAVTEGREVGVDVETVEPGRDLVALAERALEPDAAAAVREAAPEERPRVFYGAWTRHEARLKCLGVGRGDELVAVENIPWFLCPDIQDKGTTELGYAAAVAVRADEVGPIDCRSLRAR